MTSPVKQAVDFVRAHPQQMTRIELDTFKQIADEVYLMAIEAGVVEAIPKVPELRPQLESQDPPLPPVQFESKLNLSGDWGTTTPDVYMVCAAPRWFEDMGMLAELLESEQVDPDAIPTEYCEDGTPLKPGYLIKSDNWLISSRTQLQRLREDGTLTECMKVGNAYVFSYNELVKKGFYAILPGDDK